MHKRRHWAGHNLTLITTGTKLINVLLEFNVGAMIERARSTLRSCVRQLSTLCRYLPPAYLSPLRVRIVRLPIHQDKLRRLVLNCNCIFPRYNLNPLKVLTALLFI